jgi:two-component system chemotaxis response regulator CheB
MRKLLKFVIQSFEGWKVVAELENAESVPKAIEDFYPDIVTLDLHLGEKNGVQAMRESLAPKRIPTLVITSQPKADGSLVMDALEAGALDYLQKPESGNWDQLKDDLLFKMESSLKSKWQTRGPSLSSPKLSIHSSTYNPEDFLIMIGSSTGGTQALQEILTRLPPNIPPILITQHIPAGFSRALAERLNNLCPFEVKEAQEGDEIKAGRVLVAPGDHHLKISRNGKKVEIVDSDPVNRFRPSVDFMFNSVPDGFKRKIIATILTGMGKDGALGMLELKQKGALTIAQDEASSVVYGMPKEAARIGAADSIKPLLEIPQFWLDLMSKSIAKT